MVSIREEQNEFFLQIKHNSYEDPKFATEIAIVTLNKFFPSSRKKAIHINHDQLDMSMMSQKIPPYRSYNLDSIYYEQEKVPLYQDFVVKDYFPIINNYTYLAPRFFVASRERFIFSGLFLENDTEIVWKENLVTSINLKQSLVDEFDGLFIKPPTTYPNQVRSDIKDYLNNMGGRISLGRAQLDYFLSSTNSKHHLHLSAGIFEEMFGGFGFEYLFSNPDTKLAWGIEVFDAYKRDYDLDFDFTDYSNTTAHLNFFYENDYLIPLTLHLSYGEYLAGDKGFTLDLSRRFNTGFVVGIFATKTNLSAIEFGEGSFDKGFYFSIPTKLFYSDFRSGVISFGLHPLTKDGGAMLSQQNQLFALFGETNTNSIIRDWDYLMK